MLLIILYICIHVLHMSSDSPWGRTLDHLGEYAVENMGIDWFLCPCGEGKFPDIVLS